MKAEQFNEIYLPLADQLLIVSRNVLGSQHDARDVLQELYLKLWKNRNNLDDISNPAAYATTLVKNISLDRLKSNKVRQTTRVDEINDRIGTDRSEDIVHRDILSKTMQALELLPPHRREILIGRIFEEKSFEEIAEQTGHSPLYVRVQLSAARKELKHYLKGII